MTPSSAIIIIFSLTSFLLTFRFADAHGMMCTPRQRGAYSSSDKCGTEVSVDTSGSEVDYCPHCLNGGAIATTSQNLPPSGWAIYDPVIDPSNSIGRASLCGDAVGVNDHMVGGRFVPSSVPAVQTYVSGSTVDFSAELDTNHNGYFEFYLCNLDTCGTNDIHSSCFTGGHCVKLNRTVVPACENSRSDPKMHYECGPIDDKYPGRWYVPCRKTGHVGVHIVGGEQGYMRYQLPENFHCDRCVIQWYWATANSCAPRGLLDYMDRLGNPFGDECPGDGGAVGTYRRGMSECGGSLVPEEFWSCGDVRISSSPGATGKSELVAKSPFPTKTPMPSPSSMTKTPNSNADVSITPMASASPSESADGGRDEWDENAKNCVQRGDECNKNTVCCGWNQACAYRKTAEKFLCSTWLDMYGEFNHRV